MPEKRTSAEIWTEIEQAAAEVAPRSYATKEAIIDRMLQTPGGDKLYAEYKRAQRREAVLG